MTILCAAALPKKSCSGIIAVRNRTASGSERDQEATFLNEFLHFRTVILYPARYRSRLRYRCQLMIDFLGKALRCL
ncbi:MAG: hypothetical protein QOK48_1784 [Blastocatellia bacterium]|nr:hypothetical protein [Blastocatellia bacterium]